MGDPMQAVQAFMHYLRYEKRYARNTLVSYQNDLGQFTGFLNDTYQMADPRDAAQAQVRSWLASLRDAGMTPRSINRKLSAVKSFYKHLVKTGSIKATPVWAISTPKVSRRLPEFVKEKEMGKLMRQPPPAEGWKAETDKLLLELFYQTGMRLTELVNLKETQVDFSRKVIKVLGKGNKERVVPIAPVMAASIKKYIAGKPAVFEKFDKTFLFLLSSGKKLYPKYAYLVVNSALAGITTLKKKSPHILRHSFATHLMNNGADLNAVKELLGHSSLAATQVYTHNNIEKLKEAHRKAHPGA